MLKFTFLTLPMCNQQINTKTKKPIIFVKILFIKK